MNILITGASGFLGKKLTFELLKKGHKLTLVSRTQKRFTCPHTFLQWDISKKPLPFKCLKEIDAIIHLAGEPIAEKKWLKDQKQKIYNSRVQGTKNLVQSIQSHPNNVRIFISASAIGIYGNHGEREITEASSFGNDFLSKVCQSWEAASQSLIENKNIRLCYARFGLILDRDGGILKKLQPIYRCRLASPLSTGQQWMSWIHSKDAVGMLIYALENKSVKGAFNATAPMPITNKSFTLLLSKAMQARPLHKLHAPRFILRASLGEITQMILCSQQVLPEKMFNWGYSFKFKELKQALNDIFRTLPQFHFLRSQQWFSASAEQVFDYLTEFSCAKELIFPKANIHFIKTSTPKPTLNSLIEYQLKTKGFSKQINYRISRWNPPNEFTNQVDSRSIHLLHNHKLQKLGSGTLVTDSIYYKPQSRVINQLFVNPLLANHSQKALDYRYEKLENIFNDL